MEMMSKPVCELHYVRLEFSAKKHQEQKRTKMTEKEFPAKNINISDQNEL
jgi:hypothetical protein